jgi:hypothetical protein
VSRKLLEVVGEHLDCFDGVEDFFDNIKQDFRNICVEKRVDAQLGFYVISGGLEDMLLNASFLRSANALFGCTLDFDSDGAALGPKSVVTFTEKTKFLFAINKGIRKDVLRRDPSSVDKYSPRSQREIPFSRMVYVGDGPTDVPCFSIITQNGGQTVGVRKPERPELGARRQGPEHLDYRPRWGPFTADYRRSSDLYRVVWDCLESIVTRLGAA